MTIGQTQHHYVHLNEIFSSEKSTRLTTSANFTELTLYKVLYFCCRFGDRDNVPPPDELEPPSNARQKFWGAIAPHLHFDSDKLFMN